jgi:hypothetical protein
MDMDLSDRSELVHKSTTWLEGPVGDLVVITMSERRALVVPRWSCRRIRNRGGGGC